MAALAARRRKGGTRFVPPKTAEDAVPVRRIWPDGVCLTDDGEYAKTWRVSDVNYAAASKEDKEAMFLGYSDLLNSFDSDARAKVTVAVRRLDAEALGRRILIPPKGDGLDRYREEYNAMLIEKATGANSMVREIYLTIAVGGRSIQEARSYFNRASAETAAHLARLGAHCEELDAEGKLRLLRGFYRGGADDLPIDVRASMRRGHSFKDAVAPEGAGIEADRLRVGGRWARALYLTDYASYIKDGFLAELTDARRAMALSIDVVPVPTDEAVREVERRLLGVETNITNWTRRQNAVSATAKSAERATLSRRRRPRFPAGGATALWPPALPRAAAQGALDRGVVEVRGPDLNLQRRGALGVPGRDRPARDLPSAELREPDRHRDVLCAERGQPPRGVRGPHDCPLSGSPSPSAASASRSFMR